MKRLLGIVVLVSLSACGVDGEPVPPSVETSIGVGSDEVSAETGVTIGQGPFTVSWGVGL